MNRYLKLFGALAITLLVPALAFANEGGEAHGEHGWDTTGLIASFANFFILLSVLIYLFRDSVRDSLKARKSSVEKALSEAATLKAEAEAKHREYTERLATLDQELGQIKKDMIAAGIKERDRIVAEAEQKASRMRKESEFIIEQQVKQLRADITREAADAAVAAAEQLLTKATTSFDQQRIAQEYLASLQQSDKSHKHQNSVQPESRV